MRAVAISPQTQSFLSRWWYAVKPQSWPKILVAAVLGQGLGVAATGRLSWPALLVGGVFTLCDLLYIVLLNDWGDREVDVLKRRLFPNGCSPKTIPDGILPASQILIVGMLAGMLALLVALLGGWWLPRPWLGMMGAACLVLYHVYTFAPCQLNYRGGGELLEMVGVGVMLPWFNAYGQNGVLMHEVLWIIPGFACLSLASALASGLSDEESDRLGGKRTCTTMWGNAAVRLAAETLLIVGLFAWTIVALWHSHTIPWWTVVAAAGVVLWHGRKACAMSTQATTNAFQAHGLYKQHLHHAIWYGTVVLVLLLLAAR